MFVRLLQWSDGIGASLMRTAATAQDGYVHYCYALL
jgi:hypothetical protein